METANRKQFNRMIQNVAKANGVTPKETRAFFKDQLDNTTLEEMACALTHFCFRNGPVEDMHEAGKLSNSDMKTLNKFCYNKLFTFLTLLRFNELERFLPTIFLFKEAG